MAIWAIGDLHLSFGCKEKEMGIFGENWKNHHEKIRISWDTLVHPDDLVLIPGDISWAMHLEDAIADLEWIEKRPGTKVMIKGNHDYWWHAIAKVRKVLPPSIHAIYNDAFQWKDVSIGGTRLWDSPEYTFSSCIEMKEAPKELKTKYTLTEEDEKIFQREVLRLGMSMKLMNSEAKTRIIMTHYPPIGLDLQESTVSKMMEEAAIHYVLFGHLHSVRPHSAPFGKARGVEYHLTSCDYLNFKPLRIA
ncbi:MAG: hypothetical protein JWO53_1323 [Chlamydiia bacterium]|nr:hypothetical protein [Chlamydiia bacterium]